jgi:beta-ribofuranosylaminobenzene 5'-phosphate synthase
MLKIAVPARIHITLIDLGKAGYRRNGGIGFCVDHPVASFFYELSKDVDLSELVGAGFQRSEVARLEELIVVMREEIGGTGLILKSVDVPGRHVGLGVGTATAISAMEAFCIMHKIDISQREIVRYSGRGGASGIGVHGYFDGGFIFDIGRKFDDRKIKSSDDVVTPTELPLALVKTRMPEWKIGIFRNRVHNAVPLSLERSLFEKILPLPDDEVFKTAYHAIFGALAGVVDHDFDAFCAAVNELQECAWKRAELAIHGALMTDDIKRLKHLGCDAVGMTSVGPTLFFLSKDFSDTFARVIREFPSAYVFSVNPNNTGRVISFA